MITVQIDEKNLSETMKKHIEDVVKSSIEGSNLDYFIRIEIHKILSEKFFETDVKPILTKREINKLLRQAFQDYVTKQMGELK